MSLENDLEFMFGTGMMAVEKVMSDGKREVPQGKTMKGSKHTTGLEERVIRNIVSTPWQATVLHPPFSSLATSLYC